MHYLDDFIVIGPPDSSLSLTTLIQACEKLGAPIAHHKTEGPSTSLLFLGIEIDTMVRQLRLPEDKLAR